jgi:phospholipid/cholesterol/gamma-HCH transport system ATP-binding protein
MRESSVSHGAAHAAHRRVGSGLFRTPRAWTLFARLRYCRPAASAVWSCGRDRDEARTRIGGSPLDSPAQASDREAQARRGDARPAAGRDGDLDRSSADAIIELRDVELAFGKRKVFDGLSCRMRRGGIHLLLGGSGTGKSTLLRMIGGLLRPDSGSVRVAGHLLSEKSERELGQIRKEIGMLFQNGALLDSMTVLENVGLPLREHERKPWGEIAVQVATVLKSVGLEGIEGLLPRELSGGMLRRVAFARAIVMEPEILLCDEPFSGLDPINVQRIEDLLVELNRALGLTIVVTSHHMASSLRMASQMILLRNGGCIAGSPEELASSVDPEVVEFLGEDGRSYLARLHELRAGGSA